MGIEHDQRYQFNGNVNFNGYLCEHFFCKVNLRLTRLAIRIMYSNHFDRVDLLSVLAVGMLVFFGQNRWQIKGPSSDESTNIWEVFQSINPAYGKSSKPSI